MVAARTAGFGVGLAMLGDAQGGVDKLGSLDTDESLRPREPLNDLSANGMWLKRATSITSSNSTNTTIDIVDSRGDDVWDGQISNEDMFNILNDKYGLLAVTLGVLATILLSLIILTLALAHKIEKEHERAYKELYGAG
ncbi:hypothetical protein FRC12_010654 [Ceratobasidium sp. 428]|nr:hypothetical protein FRC12_010654 [Ceratobasidium sp. 428]